MLILGIDTSGKSGGITLAEGDAQSLRVLESSPIAGGTFSAQLVPTIAHLLEKHGFSANDIGLFAVASGPGSFTGLRVGLSGVKGLAEVLGAPIATVSVLEALASHARKPGRVAAAVDAGRHEVYFGLYHVDPAAIARIGENLLPQAEYLQQLNAPALDSAVTSDAALAELASSAHAVVVPELVDRPGSAIIARLGLRKLLAGQTVSVEALDANYLRRSDAEIFSQPQSKRPQPKNPDGKNNDKGARSRIAVRPGNAADLPRLTAIALHSATAAQWNREQYESLIASDAHREFLVVSEDGQVCGFIVGREAAGEWEMENIAVTGDARHRGLGSRLLGEFLNRVRARKCAQVHLEVRESNLAARKLYEKWGFVEAGRRKSYYEDPAEDALLLRFSFPQPG